MKTNFTKIVSLLCALVMILGIMPFGAFAADVSTGHHAQISEQLVYDVDLSIGGDSKSMDTDIVFMPFGSKSVDQVFFNAAIELFMPLIEAGSRVRIGIVVQSETGKNVVLDLNSDPRAVLPNDEEAIRALFNELSNDIAASANGENLEKALKYAREMLSEDTSVPSDRKYLFLFHTGNTYFFDNDEGVTSTVVMEGPDGNMYFGNRCWGSFRNNNTSSYAIPSAYNGDYNAFWADICKWVEKDQQDTVYSLNVSYEDFLNKNVRGAYGTKIVYPDTTYGKDKAVPYFKGAANPKTTVAAQHAIVYERAQYEAWVVYSQMSAPIGSTVTSVLKDSEGNYQTYEGLGFNCFPIYAGNGANNSIGYGFINMLAGGNVSIYGEDMFTKIANEILHTVSSGSFVENKIGSGNGYDFDFVVDASALSVDFGGVNYKATATGANTFTFSADGSDKVSFELIYNPENETFKFITYETPNNTKIANLNYQVKLAETPSASADDKMYVSASATLTPVDSEGVEGEKIVLARPYVINWAASEIEISTSDELAEFAKVTRGEHSFFGGDKHSFEGQIIKLANDIDLSYINGEEGWWYHQDLGIDRRIVDFKGIFDGNNKVIKNMKYDHTGLDTENSYRGLSMFRTMYGTIKNLTIDNIGGYLKADGSLEPAMLGYNARFSALANYPRGAMIQNVTVQNANIHADNVHANDAHSSVSGMLGIVTWDDTGDNTYGNTTRYSLITNCNVKDFTVTVDGNHQYAGGGFAYKASEKSTFENCHVDNYTINIAGSVDNYGGFIGEIGLASVVTDCSVADFHLTAAQNNRAVAGFMGDTVGGTGWGDSVHINGCSVSNSSIEIETVNAPIGGFVGDLIGGRSAIFGDAKANTVASDVTLTATKSGAGDGIGIPCVGGFLGGLFGRDDLTGSSEHQFTNCSAAATINAGDAPAGGFLGAAIKGEKQQMRVSFSNCTSAGSVTTTGVAAAFGGFDAEGMDIGDKANGDKNYDEYDNTCTSTTNVNGQAPANVEPVAIVGGSSTYSRTLSSGYMELADTTATSTVYTTFQDPAVQTFRLRRAPVAIDKVVEVEFYRKNAAGAYELWRTIEIFKDTAFDGTGYPYATTYADYRLTGGLASVLDEADDLFIKATAIGFIDENGNPFTDSTIVGSDIKLYAEYGYKVTYELEGSIPEEIEVPEGKIYQAGETVALPTFSEIANYEFRGWNVSADFVMPEENVTITGKWVKVAKPEITGKVKFNDILAAGQFTFILVDEEGKTVATTTNDKNGNFKFQPTLDQGNIYCYTVKQVAGNETLGYDLANFEVIIVVDDDGEFAMASGDIIFKNRAPHRAKVTIDGSVTLDGQAADGFEFVLTDRRGNEVATAESEKGKFSFAFSYTGCGKYTYYLSQVAADGVVCDDVVYEIIVTVKSVGSGYKAQVVYMRTIDLAFANTTAN